MLSATESLQKDLSEQKSLTDTVIERLEVCFCLPVCLSDRLLIPTPSCFNCLVLTLWVHHPLLTRADRKGGVPRSPDAAAAGSQLAQVGDACVDGGHFAPRGGAYVPCLSLRLCLSLRPCRPSYQPYGCSISTMITSPSSPDRRCPDYAPRCLPIITLAGAI